MPLSHGWERAYQAAHSLISRTEPLPDRLAQAQAELAAIDPDLDLSDDWQESFGALQAQLQQLPERPEVELHELATQVFRFYEALTTAYVHPEELSAREG